MIVPRLYEDLSVLHQNTMPDRAYYVPSSVRGDRLAWHRESSDRLQMLSGCEWRFAWYPSIHDGRCGDMTAPSTPTSAILFLLILPMSPRTIRAGHIFTILNGTGIQRLLAYS